MAKSTKEEAERTRLLLLETAAELFARDGVSQTSLVHIAKSAGLTRGAIYWHFSNKDDLYYQLADHSLAPVTELINHYLIAEQAEPLKSLHEFSIKILKLTANDPKVRRWLHISFNMKACTNELEKVQQQFKKEDIELVDQLEALFCQEKNKLLVSPRVAAISIHSYLIGLLSAWLTLQEHYDLDQQAEALVSCWFNGVIKPS